LIQYVGNIEQEEIKEQAPVEKMEVVEDEEPV
jgi:hypothetical protein